MIQKTWLAASMALVLTVGVGASLLTGDDTVTSASQDGIAPAAARAWTIPGVTVVVHIPARADGEYVLASSVETSHEEWTVPGITVVAQIPDPNRGFTLAGSVVPPLADKPDQETAEDEWTIPGITVVAQVPVKGAPALVLASSTEETLSPRAEQTIEDTAEETWTMPGITVVAQASAKTGRAYAMGGPSFPAPRPSWVRARPSRMEKPATPFRDMRRYDDRRIGERVLGI